MTNSGAGMPCPVCKVPLAMSDRQGVEIDYCPQCRGVWLDRGELDKIIERSLTAEAPAQVRSDPNQGYRGHSDDHARSRGYPKKRKSFLEELFD
jgi:Zn-finger nucleic acid-binding protein